MVEATTRKLGHTALVGMLAFAAVCTAEQCLRSDLNWQDAPLSFYLIGPGGHWVQAVYFLLSAALVLLGAGFYGALQREARSAAPLLLFTCAAIALFVTALAHTNVPQHAPTLEGFVHGAAAQAAFLCVTVAMLLQSWRLRSDARWRPYFRTAFVLALLCFVALWVDALWHTPPRGLAQKVVIVLILCWLLRAAWWLRRGPPRHM